MSSTEKNIIAGPKPQFHGIIIAVAAIVFGAAMIGASQLENNPWFMWVGIAIIPAGIVLAFQYKQTVVDLTARKWIRSKGGLFGKKSEEGPLDEITAIDVFEGRDSKKYKYWDVSLKRKQGLDVDWHKYTYLGEKGMRSDVARLEAALGVPVVNTTQT